MKKLTALLLAVLLVVTSAVAFAAPSVTVDDATAVVSDSPFVVVVDNTAIADAQLANIQALVADGKTAAEAFSEETAAAIGDAALEEFFSVAVVNGDQVDTDLAVAFTFAVPFSADKEVKAVLSVFDANNNAEEAVLDGTVTEDGAVSFTFTLDTIQKMIAGAANTIAVFTK